MHCVFRCLLVFHWFLSISYRNPHRGAAATCHCASATLRRRAPIMWRKSRRRAVRAALGGKGKLALARLRTAPKGQFL